MSCRSLDTLGVLVRRERTASYGIPITAPLRKVALNYLRKLISLCFIEGHVGNAYWIAL